MLNQIIQQVIRQVGPRVAAIMAPMLANGARIGLARGMASLAGLSVVIAFPFAAPIGFIGRSIENATRDVEKSRQFDDGGIGSRSVSDTIAEIQKNKIN